jgi:hypothetical protein
MEFAAYFRALRVYFSMDDDDSTRSSEVTGEFKSFLSGGGLEPKGSFWLECGN